MRKRLTALILLFVFVSGAPLIFAEEQHPRRKHCPGRTEQDKRHSVEDKVTQWSKELNLSAEQQVKVKDILSKSKDQARAVLDESKAKIKELNIKSHDEIKALLTEEQKQKFKDLRQKHETAPEIKE